MDYNKHIQDIIDVLEKKFFILEDTLGLTNSQTDTIIQEDLKTLEKLVQKKQEKIDDIKLLDARFNTLFSELKIELDIENMEELSGKKNFDVKALKGITSKILKAVADISIVEKQNNAMMLKLMENSRKEIKNIANGKRALFAYTPRQINTPSYYLDKKK